MRGHNLVIVSGNIGGNIVKSETKDGRSACSFGVASQNDKRRTTWIRVNAYDKLADYCKTVLEKGLYVSIVGELMNRDGKYGELTEVRAHEAVFHTASKDFDRSGSDPDDDFDDPPNEDSDNENDERDVVRSSRLAAPKQYEDKYYRGSK